MVKVRLKFEWKTVNYRQLKNMAHATGCHGDIIGATCKVTWPIRNVDDSAGIPSQETNHSVPTCNMRCRIQNHCAVWNSSCLPPMMSCRPSFVTWDFPALSTVLLNVFQPQTSTIELRGLINIKRQHNTPGCRSSWVWLIKNGQWSQSFNFVNQEWSMIAVFRMC